MRHIWKQAEEKAAFSRGPLGAVEKTLSKKPAGVKGTPHFSSHTHFQMLIPESSLQKVM
jgi:hypothetical protein